MKVELSSEIVVLREIASAVARERNDEIGDLSIPVQVKLLNVTRFSAPAIAMLQTYAWPGNVRELGLSPRMMCYKMKKAGVEQ